MSLALMIAKVIFFHLVTRTGGSCLPDAGTHQSSSVISSISQYEDVN